MSRIKNSFINVIVALAGQFLGIIISFVARIFFIKILGAEYLGINGLFTNILTVISLVELGIGPAIVYSLYKPLAQKDTRKVKALMQLYKKTYTIIGIVVGILGVATAPFIQYFIKETPEFLDVNLIFLLFVLNSAISYFFAYKRNLIIADQHRYVATVYRYIFFALLNVLQIVFLYFTGSYLVFLSLQIISTLMENVAVERHADKMYPFLKDREHEKLDSETINEIKKNTGAMVLHKIGGIVINSTDNIIISAKIGIVWVGLYSNYLLIITALDTIIGQFFASITASVGNLGVNERTGKALEVFKNVQFVNFWLISFSSVCLYYLLNPFIELWIGRDMLMSMGVVTILVINFYVQGMRKAVLTFTDALGLYWHGRYKPIVESIANLTLSILLAPKFGIAGVLIGTLISTLTTCFWIEPYILYKKGFNTVLKPYYLKYVTYTTVTLATGLLTGQLVNLIRDTTVLAFSLKLLICLLAPNFLYVLLFYRTKEFQYFLRIAQSMISKVKYFNKK